MNKIQKYHHSITELGTLQVRLITEIQDDEGNQISQEMSDPMTPAKIPVDAEGNSIPKAPITETDGTITPQEYDAVNGYDLTGWDNNTKALVEAITDPIAIEEFQTEQQKPTGIGLEEIITYDRVVENDGRIALRRITRIYENGKEISKKYHRSWVTPTDDPEASDVMTKTVAKKVHTQAIKDAFIAANTAEVVEPTKEELLAALDVEKTKRLEAGFTVNDILFDSDTKAEMRYMQLATKFEADPTYVQRWKAANNVWVDIDASLFSQIITAFEAHISGVYTWLEVEQEKLETV